MSRSDQQVFTMKPKFGNATRYRTMKHQVRMEIVAKTGKKTLDAGMILADLMHRANEKENVDFIDIDGNPFCTNAFPDPTEFSNRLAAETVVTGTSTKVTMGFFMISSANMQRIKLSIGYDWLRQQNIYIRTQRMNFQHGTDLFLMGYKTMVHPAVANLSDVEASIRDIWYSHMDRLAAEHDTNADDKAFLDTLAQLEDAQLVIDDVLQIPISVERTVVKVECPGKNPFEVPVLQVYVPRRYRDAANYLNDRAILETRTLSTLIPFSVAKNDPSAFYPQMVAHAKYLHDHRSMTIKAVPPSDYSTVPSIKEIADVHPKQMTLRNALLANKLIAAIHTNFDNRSVTISTTASQAQELHQWLSMILPLYPYRPLCSVDHGPSHGHPGDSNLVKLGKYSKVFASVPDSDSTVDSTFDPSTIASTRTPRQNAWAHGPPINVTFDRRTSSRRVSVDPTLPVRTHHGYGPTPRESSLPDDEDVVIHDADDDDSGATTPLTRPSASPSDIASLIERALNKERHALDDRIARLEKQHRELLAITQAAWDQKLVDMRKEIVDATVQGTMSVLTGVSSPFNTREDAQQQRADNAVEFQALKESMASNHTVLDILQQNMTVMLRRTEQMFSAQHDRTIQSPPRKTRTTENALPADSFMSDAEGVSES